MKFFSRCFALLCLLLLLVLVAWLSHRSAARVKGSLQRPPPPSESSLIAPAPVGSIAANHDDPQSLRRGFTAVIRDIGERDDFPPIELVGRRIHARGVKVNETRAGPVPYMIQFIGPLKQEWREAVETRGGIVHGYLPHHALSVDLTAAAVKCLAREPFVRAIVPLEDEFKVDPFLDYLAARPAGGAPDVIPVTISVYRPGDVAAVRAQLTAMSIAVTAADEGRRWGWLRAELPCDQLYAVAALERVQWIEEYVEPRIVNDLAVIERHLNVDAVWNGHGLTGAGQIIGHADTGLDLGNMNNQHPDFAGRVLIAFARGRPGLWDDPNGHGTHTAGSILGNGTMSTGQFRGVAWNAKLVHQSLINGSGGLGGLPSNLNVLFLEAYTNGARIHSDSWGSSTFGSYTTSSRQSDEFMWDHPEMLLVFAAGNDGWDSGDGVVDPQSVGSPATAKNVLTVGAAESDRAPGSGGYSSRTYGSLWSWDYPVAPIRNDYVSSPHASTNQGMAAFSSRGPTQDGRIKPDVVAPGTDVVSTQSRHPGAGAGWGNHPNSAYSFNGGTSMSTPLVAGAAALVREYFQKYRQVETPSAALLKAALMHGARSLAPGQYGEGEFLEVPFATPNIVEGWGQVNLGGTLFPEASGWTFADQKTGLAQPGDHFDHVFYAETGMVKVTLNYTDYPATAGAGKKLVNDLDVRALGPGGTEATPPRDRTNAAEQIRFVVSAAGLYTARVEAINVPSGPQPYALMIGGSVIDPPRIHHTPLANTYETNQPYRVAAVVFSSSSLPSNSASLFWREITGGPEFHHVVLTPVSNGQFEAWIPAHSRGAVIEYYLQATAAVYVALSPAGAPDAMHTFEVTEPLTLTVNGVPAPIFSVDPPYGAHTVASGTAVRLTAPAFTNMSPGMRLAVGGWTGTGSVPASGSTNDVAVIVREPSSITWEWVTQYALAQSSSVTGIIAATSWWNAWSFAATVTAPKETAVGSQKYGLAGWWLDGARQPDPTSEAVNPVAGIVMYAARTAVANYLPAAQDSNTNALPDWWEQFYFGPAGSQANIDSDGDGFTNLKEYQDRTNPRDAADFPRAPAIAHIPLANPQTSPAPWSIRAVISDNFAVSNATVFWMSNGGSWTSAAMTVSATSNFTGVIHPPGVNGDVFVYRIEAVDFAGLQAVSGPYLLNVQYPRLMVSPEILGEVEIPAASSTTTWLTITNAGLTPLHWTVDRASFFDHVENGTNAWSHGGSNDVWHIRTNRYASAEHAWHFGNGPSGLYPDGANAWLDMPPLYLDAPARLRFEHWARMEYDDEQQDDHYWDGGVVELSVDDGQTYFMIHPVGGYPHRITENPQSPFPPETPCYGETEGWETAEFDLTAFTGESVRIRFRFGSDKYVREEGWYIDNVRVNYLDDSSWSWLDVSPNGILAPGRSTNIAVTFSTASLAPAERRQAVLVVDGNDPELGAPVLIPVSLHNLSREIMVTHSAHGSVAPSGSVLAIKGGTTSFLIIADVFYTIGAVLANGEPWPGIGETNETLLVWTNIQDNGTLHVEFVEALAAGLVPEWWLAYHGLTNQAPEVEAVTDHDGDGMLTWQEYWAQTDPNNPDSVALTILQIDPSVNGAVIEWLSFTNPAFRYDVHRATDLMGGFEALATNLPATPPLNVFTNNGGAWFEIFRVEKREME